MIGRPKRGGNEAAFDALVERSERLAREPCAHTESSFEALVADAVERLSEEFQES